MKMIEFSEQAGATMSAIMHLAAAELITVCVSITRQNPLPALLRHFDVSWPHLQRRASSGCPGTSQPPRRRCSGYRWGRPEETHNQCHTRARQKTTRGSTPATPVLMSVLKARNKPH